MEVQRGTWAFPSLVTILITGVLGIAYLVWWVPERARRHRVQNEQHATACLKMLASAEAEFRANDGDGNGINDFWTADVAGLWVHGELVPRALAAADTRPVAPIVPSPVPKDGYFFIVMEGDGSEFPPEDYRTETDKHSGKVHHLSKFAFCAYPAEYNVSGSPTWIINEGNSIYMGDTGGKPVTRWPNDEDRRSNWSKPQ